MKGLVISNCGRIFSITKASRKGDNKIPPCKNLVWRFLFEEGNCKLSKDGNSKLWSFNANQFKDYVKSWPTKFCISSHTLWQKMKFTKLKAKLKTPIIWSHGINNPKKLVHVPTLTILNTIEYSSSLNLHLYNLTFKHFLNIVLPFSPSIT